MLRFEMVYDDRKGAGMFCRSGSGDAKQPEGVGLRQTHVLYILDHSCARNTKNY
jgi:hypothetical protein